MDKLDTFSRSFSRVYTFESRQLILGPRVTIETPADGSAFTEPKINIVGKAENITSLSLNGRPIFIDESGNFREELLLQKGYTILTIGAEDRFGRKTKKQLHLVRY